MTYPMFPVRRFSRAARSLRLALYVKFICLGVALLFENNTLIAQGASFQAKIKHVQASSDRPLWQMDLRSLGYPSENPELQRRRGLEDFDTIDFVGDGVLAATFVTREFIPVLQRRDDSDQIRPYKLHAIFLDANSGKVLHTLEWPIENPSAGIFPRDNGGFLFLSTNRIAVYSKDWAVLKELSLLQLHDSVSTLGGIAESPSGKALVIQFLQGSTARCFRISTGSLDSSESPCGILDLFTVSDEGLVAPHNLPDGNVMDENSPTGAFVEYGATMPDAPLGTHNRIQSPEQPSAVRTFCSSCFGMPQFINNSTIVVYSPLRISVVEQRSGEVRFANTFDSKEKWIDEFGRPVRSSANGERFALASNVSKLRVGDAIAIHMATGDLPAEFANDVEVYDLQAGQWIYTLQIKGNRIQQIWGLALSPSGGQLAIDSGGVIQNYQLPPK